MCSRTCCFREKRQQRSIRNFDIKDECPTLVVQLIVGQLKSPRIKTWENLLESINFFSARDNSLSSSRGVWGGLYMRITRSFSCWESFMEIQSESMKVHLGRGLGDMIEEVNESDM